jgi:hypothetical protein
MVINVPIIETDNWARENRAAQIGQARGNVCAGAYRTREEKKPSASEPQTPGANSL